MMSAVLQCYPIVRKLVYSSTKKPEASESMCGGQMCRRHGVECAAQKYLQDCEQVFGCQRATGLKMSKLT